MVERLVFSRWTVLLPLAGLLLLCTTGVWFYRAEESSALEKARQQLAVITRLEVERIVAERRRPVLDGSILCSDPYFLSLTSGFFAESRGKEIVADRLQTVCEQGGYRSVLLLDASGAIRLCLGQPVPHPDGYAEAVPRAMAAYQPVLIDMEGDGPTDGYVFAAVIPLVRADRRQEEAMGAVVLVVDAGRTYQAVAAPPEETNAAPQAVLVRRDQDNLIVVSGALSANGGIQVHKGPEDALANTMVGRAASGWTGLIRERNHVGVPSLGFIRKVPGSDWLLVVAEPVARIFSLWRYRAAVLLLVFSGMAGCAAFFWQFDRKAHYKALYDAESRFRRSLVHQNILLQAIGDGVVAVDRTGMVELMNPVAEQLTGWLRDEALGRPLEEVFHVVDGYSGEPVRYRLQDIEQGPQGKTTGTFHLLLPREGNELVIAEVAAPLRNDRGEVVGAVVAFHDQTREHLSRQRTEACLRLREYANSHGVHDLLHQALEEVAVLMKSPKAVWCDLEDPWYSAAVKRVPDSGGICQWQSASATNEAGYAEIGQWLSTMPDEAIIIDPAATTGQRPSTDPTLQQCRFGTVREILFPLRRSGRLTAAMVVSDKERPYSDRDVETVTRMGEYIWRLLEQKQMEEALLASERRYRTLYRSMMDAFVVTDLKGRIRECNDAYASLLGFSAEELKGRFVNEFTPRHWQEFEKEHLRVQLMSSGRTELYEKEYQRRDGVLVPVELRTFLLMDNEGQPEGVSAVVRDITRRRQAQEEREKLRDRLNLAQKLESVGQLAGGVAHDFNNMLGVIIGYAELALRTMDIPQPLGKYLVEIVKAGKRSADVTRQLLAFARKQTIAPRILDLNDTLGGMLKMLHRLIGEDVELLWLPGMDIWPVKMDPSQIDQLLANLCVNARDAIKGVGKITIETGKVSFDEAYCRERSGFIPGDYVVLVVSDNGSGIERDILDKIFEPFFTTKGVGQGTGLGLATVYGIVKQNNGFINVYSEPGRGTTFRIYLPRQEGNAEVGGMDDIKAVPLGQGEVVLVVEDEESMLALNRTMLDQLNYKVLTASTPTEAVRIAKEFGQAIDLLLTDVIMPEMNGRELARVICGYCPDVKTLFMSGYTANVIAHRGELDAGTHFITKPFSTEELALKARETLLDQPTT